MISTILYETRRLLNWQTILIFTLYIASSLYFVFLGVADYKSFQENKKDFSTIENNKLQFYLRYEQYGATGFRVILEPSALSVFFNRNDYTGAIEALIDTSENIKIYNGRKGKNAFSLIGRFGDLNQSMSIFGTLIMMLMGFSTFQNKFHIEYFNRKNYLKTIFTRVLLLDMFFISLLATAYAFARFFGVTFLPQENVFFFLYGLFALLLLNLAYLCGLMVKVFFKYKKQTFQILMVAWFIFALFIPEIGKVYRSMKASQLASGERVDMEKLQTLLNTELKNRQAISDFVKNNPNLTQKSPEFQKLLKTLYREYMNNDYLLNKKREDDLLKMVKRDIDIFSFLNTIFPIDFLNYFSAEVSGKGYNGYIDFFKYVIKLRDEFMQFYIQKRYEIATDLTQEGVESFIKNSENIYPARAHLPENVGLGLVLIVVYILILSGLTYWRRREKKITGEHPEILQNFKHGQILFLLVNKTKQDELANALRQGQRSFLHRESHLILNEEITASRFIDYACREKKIKKAKVMENLELFDIQEKDLHKKTAKYPEEIKQKIICSLVFAEANEVIIINDFIKGAPAGFEKQFLDLVGREANADRKIVYLGNEIYTPTASLFKSDIHIKTYQPFQLDPQQISLR